MTTGTGSFSGRLKALSVADVLIFLRGLRRVGLLSFAADGVVVGLYLKESRVIHATSTREADRLTEILLRDGTITGAQLEDALRRAAGGERIGKALVASGAITPRGLMEARLRQVRQIALSLFEWAAGEFVFHEGEALADDGLAVDVPLLELVIDGVRGLKSAALVRERMPSPDWIFEALPTSERRVAVPLEPQEEAILRLVDGTRAVGAIAAAAEFPETETLRVLFLLFAIGYTKMKALPGPDVDEAADAESIAAVVRRYNAMLGRVYQYLIREVGPISEHLLIKTLRSMKIDHPVLFSRASLGGDGTIDAGLLEENLRGLSPARRRETLVQGLNELLYAELLVLRRTLGVEHEGRVLRSLRDAPQRSGLSVAAGP